MPYTLFPENEKLHTKEVGTSHRGRGLHIGILVKFLTSHPQVARQTPPTDITRAKKIARKPSRKKLAFLHPRPQHGPLLSVITLHKVPYLSSLPLFCTPPSPPPVSSPPPPCCPTFLQTRAGAAVVIDFLPLPSLRAGAPLVCTVPAGAIK